MLFIVLAVVCTILAILGWIALWDDSYSDAFEKVALTAGVGLLWAGGLAVCFGLSMGIAALFTDSQPQYYGQWDLQQIQTDSTVQGRFFLGSGYIDGVQQYQFYYKDGQGYRIGTADADDTLVLEGGKPHAKQEVTYFSRWFIPHHVFKIDTQTGMRWTIHVPHGSIKPLVNMDLHQSEG